MAIPTKSFRKKFIDMLNDRPISSNISTDESKRILSMNVASTTTTQRTGNVKTSESTFPIEGQGKKFLQEMALNSSESFVIEVLLDMASSGSGQDRAYAAAHRLTPISIVSTMLGDTDRIVRYIAEKRLLSDEHDRIEREQLNQEQP